MILVDSNVILDIATADPRWIRWSEQQLARWADQSVLVINPIIYAEVSVNYATIEELDSLMALFEREPLPYEAGFLAGKAFHAYRRRGGPRRSPMPDFYIGAHAACKGYRLLTRDPARYRTYFPKLAMIAPEVN